MGQIKSCPQCGAALSETTLDGLCPACAVGVVLTFALESSPGQPLPDSGTASSDAKPTPFGEFELIEEIARGGMGVVYKARQKRLNRMVALKMILAGRFAGVEQVKRFRAEAEAAASLRHPNIVAIHDIGEVAGQHYFCMDLIEGPNLAHLVRDHPLSQKNAARLVQEVAQAVQYAHERGVVHRDLKPSNVILDQAGHPHVTDFGLAKRLDGNSDLTQSGQVLGSPNFAAPEQAGGRSRDVRPRSDVYSLGAILYYLLAGRPPFLAESFEQTLSMVLADDPLPPRRLDPGVPRDLETICLKCLEKDPDKRYAAAGLLADELERFLRGEPIQARPIGTPEKVLRWARRNRTVSLLTGLAAMILFLGVTGVFWQWQRAERSASREYHQRTRVEATVAHLQWQKAEEMLAHDDSFQALSYLAQILRQSPTNHAVAERIVSVLSQRQFPLPVTPPMRHQDAVLAAAFSHDGRRAATASADGTAMVWDTANGRRRIGTLAHEGPVNVIRFSRDDSLILTGSEDGAIRAWDTATGQERVRFQNGTNAVTHAEFDPQGRFVLAATRDQRVTVWGIATGVPAFAPIPHSSRVTAARFSPQRDRFLTASYTDGVVRVFEALTGHEIHSFDFNGSVLSARFSPDGRRIVVASYGGWACIWTPDGSQPLVTVRHDDVVNDAALSPDGLLLATISRDRRALVWDSRTGDLVFSLPVHLTWVEEMAFGPDGLTLMTREQGNRVVLWDLLSGRPYLEPIQTQKPLRGALLSPEGGKVMLSAMDGSSQIWRIEPAGISPLTLKHQARAVMADFSPDGQHIVVSTVDGSTIVYDAIRGLPEQTFKHRGAINSVQYSRDGSKVLTASNDRTAAIWDLKTGNSVTVPHRQRVIYAEFSPDGRTFVTASFDGTARTWLTESGEPLSEPMPHPGRLWQAVFSPDGRLVATACDDTGRDTDHHARIWDAGSGRPVTAPLRHQQRVYRVHFDPTGQFLATASADNAATLWRVSSGERILEFKHNGPIRHVVFSPEGSRILTASQDNTARIWKIRTGEAIGEPMRHAQEVEFAEWSPDGQRVATACGDGSVRLWDALTGRPTTEPMRLTGMGRRLRFSPDGRRLACPALPTCIWTLPRIVSDPPHWLADLAEAVAGSRLNLSPATANPASFDLFELGQKLISDFGPDAMTSWARWFFEDRFLPEKQPRPIETPSGPPLSSENFDGQPKASLVKALHTNPANASAWYHLSNRLRTERMQNNPFWDAQAEYCNRKAVALNPGSLPYWVERLAWLKESKRTELLSETLNEACRHHPASVELHRLRAEWLEGTAKLAEAADAYRRVLDLETNRLSEQFFRAAHRRRGLLIQLGERNRAQDEWRATMDVALRPENLPPSCIDLTAHYNAALREPWHDRKRHGNDLSQVSPGRFVARQIEFDVRGIIQLAGVRLNQFEPGFPNAVTGIAVGRTAEKIHFLHAAAWGFAVPDDTLVGKYVVHYMDGVTETIVLKKNVDLHEWFHQRPAPLADLAGAQTVDMGRNAANIPVRLFLKTWPNPRRTVPIATIDFVSEMTGAAPFLVALTVEP